MKQLGLFSPYDNKDFNPEPLVQWELFIDGAARNNPGPAGAGIFILKNSEVVYKNGFYLGKKTNNEAEYLALLIGLAVLQQIIKTGDQIKIASDSQLLVRQLQGQYRVRTHHLIPLFNRAKRVCTQLQAHIRHVPREHNTEADQMANHGIDIKNPLPHDLIALLHTDDIKI